MIVILVLLQDKSSGGGPRQRAEALAALNSAFNSSTSRPAYSVNIYLNTNPMFLLHVFFGK